jgi:CHASE3 domain sensor protein
MELEKRITRFSLIQRTLVKVREIQGFDAAVAYLASVEAPRVTRELIQQIRAIEDHEQKLLAERKKMREELISSFNWLYISLLSSVFIALIIVYSNIIATLRKARNS